MILHTLAFYMFATLVTLSAVMVITARNPVHSVLFLIFAFFNAAGLFILLGAEFLAMVLVIVYVGAVAVLFLFVVMMLDIDFAELRKGSIKYLPLASLIAGLLMFEMVLVLSSWVYDPTFMRVTFATVHPGTLAVPGGEVAGTNTALLGNIMYTHYAQIFIISGLILFVAMIGAIVLTLRSRSGVRKQKVEKQVYRTMDQVLEIRKVESGKGI